MLRLNHWFHVDPSGADSHGVMTISATWTDRTRGIHHWTVTGTLVDPKPGDMPHYTFVPCTRPVTGHRVTP